MIYSIFSLLLLFLFSALLTFFYIHYAQRKKWLDIPNQRSSHTEQTPRGGGIVFITLWSFATLIASFQHLISLQQSIALLPGTLLIALVGFYDDRLSLSATHRAFWYFLTAAISLVALRGFPHVILNQDLIIPLSGFGSVLALLAIVWSINLFNFMDGTDGVAAMEALFVLGVGGFFLWQAGGQGLAWITWLLAICVLGFFIWNKPPAKLFMGDVGSTSLGFVIMVLAIIGENQYKIPASLWCMTYGLFIFDTTITLIRRLFAKHKWYEAHRLHAYQRLYQWGWSHSKIVWAVVGVNSVLAGLAITGFYFPRLLLSLLLVAIGFLSYLYLQVERIYPMTLHANQEKNA